MKFYNLFIAFFPLSLITILGYFFPINPNQFKPIFQPPNWVFGLVWPFLLLSFGIVSSLVIKKIKIFYLIILSLLAIWLIFNYYQKYKLSFIILLKSVFWTTLYLCYLIYIGYPKLAIFILPLLFWLVYASCLNGVIYQYYTHKATDDNTIPIRIN